MIYIIGSITLLLYVLLFKDFVFVSFDPTSAKASGFPVRMTNAILFLLIAVSIAICTRAVGAMPVFALTVLPPAAALQIHDRMLPAVITSAAFGAVAAAPRSAPAPCPGPWSLAHGADLCRRAGRLDPAHHPGGAPGAGGRRPGPGR